LLLRELPPSPQRARMAEFARIAGVALAQTGNLLGSTASPIGLQRAREDSRSSLLSAQVQAYALALTVTFLALLLAAGAIASERDENTIGRLRREPVGHGRPRARLAARPGPPLRSPRSCRDTPPLELIVAQSHKLHPDPRPGG